MATVPSQCHGDGPVERDHVQPCLSRSRLVLGRGCLCRRCLGRSPTGGQGGLCSVGGGPAPPWPRVCSPGLCGRSTSELLHGRISLSPRAFGCVQRQRRGPGAGLGLLTQCCAARGTRDRGTWTRGSLGRILSPVPGGGPGGSTWPLEPHGHRFSRQEAESQHGQLTAQLFVGPRLQVCLFPKPVLFPGRACSEQRHLCWSSS